MPTNKYFFGTNGDDRGTTALNGTDTSSFVDNIYGLNGNDELFGYGGTDFLFGGDGDDLLDGGTGIDFVYGGDGFDTLTYAKSGAGVNVSLATGAASGGHAGGDTFAQIEAVRGSTKADVLEGNDVGINSLSGGKGADTLRGNGGFDLLEGGDGNDKLDGGAAVDAVYGGKGKDTFRYDSVADAAAGTQAHDFIGDFSQGQKDKIDLSARATGSGDAEFDFLGSSSFYEAGQVRFIKGGRPQHGPGEHRRGRGGGDGVLGQRVGRRGRAEGAGLRALSLRKRARRDRGGQRRPPLFVCHGGAA